MTEARADVTNKAPVLALADGERQCSEAGPSPPGAVKPAMTTSWRFDVLIFSQSSVLAPDRYWLSARLAMMPSRPSRSASLKNFAPKVAR